MLHSKFNKVNKYVIHLQGHVHPMTMVGTLVYDEDTSPLLQPSPRSKKVLVGDKGVDIVGIMSGRITDYEVYEILGKDEDDDDTVTVLGDNGEVLTCHISWFKEVYLYDEDETLLTCRDIEFQEGDYIDLRKHTPDQIRHIAEYYNVFKLEETLGELDVKSWKYLLFYPNEGDFGAVTTLCGRGVEYTYDDIFYLEDN